MPSARPPWPPISAREALALQGLTYLAAALVVLAVGAIGGAVLWVAR